MMTLEDLKKKLFSAGLCDKYAQSWQGDVSKEDMFKAALTLDGIDFITATKPAAVCDFKAYFSDFLNKPYQCTKDGINGAILADYEGLFKVPREASVISVIGHSICRLDLSDCLSCLVNIADSSYVELMMRDGVFFRIRAHDKSIVSILEMGDHVMAAVWLFGSQASLMKRNPNYRVHIKNVPKLTLKGLYEDGR